MEFARIRCQLFYGAGGFGLMMLSCGRWRCVKGYFERVCKHFLLAAKPHLEAYVGTSFVLEVLETPLHIQGAEPCSDPACVRVPQAVCGSIPWAIWRCDGRGLTVHTA